MSRTKNNYSAPWELEGEGYIIPFFNTNPIKNKGLIRSLREKQKSKVGFIIIVRYSKSNVGPYDEILFVPGKVKFMNKLFYTISNIFVSTKKSVVNGKKNWGIPKKLAKFKFEKSSSCTDRVIIKKEDKIFLDIVLKHSKIKFPISTNFFNTSLLHVYEKKTYITKFSAKGSFRFARISSIKQFGKVFPIFKECKPRVVFKVEKIKLKFSEAKTYGDR